MMITPPSFLGILLALTGYKVVLKLYGVASSSKIRFSKAKLYEQEHIKIELIYQDKWNSHNFPLKYFKSN